MPIRYDAAPLLIDNKGQTDVPSLKKMIERVNRKTWCAKFSSNFRSRKQPLGYDIAVEIKEVYRERSRRGISVIAKDYVEALPYPPPAVDDERETTYQSYLSKLEPVWTLNTRLPIPVEHA